MQFWKQKAALWEHWKLAHDCYEIVTVLEGTYYTYLNDEEILVNEESVVVIPPGTVHCSQSTDGFRDLFIHVDQIPAIQDEPFVFADQTGVVHYLGQLIYTTWLQKDYNYRSITSSTLALIIEHIIKFQGKGYEFDFVRKLKEILVNQFSDSEFDLAKVNLNLGVSKSYLRSCFKKETGVTPLEYLTNLRVQQAESYLMQNRYMSIGEIASACGFKDIYYFSRCFKKKNGVSPSEFRNND